MLTLLLRRLESLEVRISNLEAAPYLSQYRMTTTAAADAGRIWG